MKLNFTAEDVSRLVNSKLKGKIGTLRSKESLTLLATELWESIANRYCVEIPSAQAGDFSMSDISISTPVETKTGCDIRISVDPDALHRYSLVKEDGGYTGSGVYDIFGLITQGYSTKTAVGYWADKQGVAKSMGYVLSLSKREPNPFIQEVANEFETIHGGVTVELPELWS